MADEELNTAVIDMGGDETPPEPVNDDPALSGEFDNIDGGGTTPPAEPADPPPAEPDPAPPAEPAAAPANPSEPPPAVPSPGSAPPASPTPAAAVQPVSPPSAPAPAFDPATVKPADLVTSLVSELGDVELADESADGGKVKLADLAKDSPSFMQAAAVMAQAMVEKALAPYRSLMPAIQEQAVSHQRETMLAGIEQAGIEDARALVQTNEFWAWVDAQPPEIKAAADSLNPASVAMAMKLYKAETGQTAPAQAARQERAAAVAAKAAKSAGLHKGVETSRSAAAPVPGGADDPKKLKDDFENLPDD